MATCPMVDEFWYTTVREQYAYGPFRTMEEAMEDAEDSLPYSQVHIMKRIATSHSVASYEHTWTMAETGVVIPHPQR